ncbi:MAG: lipocalin-like domain-containing protein [Bacteroidota bacterium]
MRILFACLLFLIGCKFVPYNGNDKYTDKADLGIDEAPHIRNSLEWWYYTGHLMDVETGKGYGLEFVFFHFNPRNKKDYIMVNFAITDSSSQKFYFDYKIKTLTDLLKDDLPINLSYEDKKESYTLTGQMGEYQLSGKMGDYDISVDLLTKPQKPAALHSGTGYENYGGYATAGYYSYPRLSATGSLRIGSHNMNVTGELWYDRQWNCIGVWQREVAWDWFSVQLDDPKEELMLYRVYHIGDNATIYGGTYFKTDGSVVDLENGDIVLNELEYWDSKKSKVRYPVKWSLEVKSLSLSMELEAVLLEQELALKFSPIHKLYYWEGMCNATGNLKGKAITGNSYIEITNRSVVNK